MDFSIKSLQPNKKETPPFDLRRNDGVNNYLLLLFKSHGELTVKNKVIPYSPNDLIIIEPNVAHAINTLDNILIHDWIHFNIDNLDVNNCKVIFNQLIPCNYAHLISNFINLIYNEFIENPKNNSIINQLMNLVFSYIEKNNTLVKKLSDNEIKVLPKFNELRNRLYASCNSFSSVNDMASSLFISESRFSHLYKKYYKISPLQDILNAKIQTAKQLLVTTNDTLTSIAINCGFSSVFSFIRCFKSKTGQTPSQWRH